MFLIIFGSLFKNKRAHPNGKSARRPGTGGSSRRARSGVEAVGGPARDEQEDAAHHRRCPGPEDPRVVRGGASQRRENEHRDRCRDLAFRGPAFGRLFVAGDHDEGGDETVEEIPQSEGVPNESVGTLFAPERATVTKAMMSAAPQSTPRRER